MLDSYSTSGNSPTYVYLIGNVDHNIYKIGVADNVEKRLKQLATACPYALSFLSSQVVEGRELAFQLEARLHERFKDERIRPDGEWFNNIDVSTYPYDATNLALELKSELAREQDTKYVADYTEWYVRTGQTRGDSPTFMSLRLLGTVSCPMCANSEACESKRFVRVKDVNEFVARTTSLKTLITCPTHGEMTIEELCAYVSAQKYEENVPI